MLKGIKDSNLKCFFKKKWNKGRISFQISPVDNTVRITLRHLLQSRSLQHLPHAPCLSPEPLLCFKWLCELSHSFGKVTWQKWLLGSMTVNHPDMKYTCCKRQISITSQKLLKTEQTQEQPSEQRGILICWVVTLFVRGQLCLFWRVLPFWQ